ncbi:MAG: M28 family peptidase [Flavobacteriales bacterium]|nr:M28 family peptidase [Flavobacteriales bacterium]
MNKLKYFIPVLLLIASAGCEDDPPVSKPVVPKPVVTPPVFMMDSAYHFVQHQVDFGPRVPNTSAHAKCADWLAQKLRGYGASVIVQEAEATAFDGTKLNMKNIIGAFNPTAKKRILLCAHWDTRPFADKDSLESNWHKPIDGANDGGSGVAVLLELARMFQQQPLAFGVDIIFFDAEDYGKPEFLKKDLNDDDVLTWCLGSQYWASHLHKPSYQAKYGILLDMVGAKDATFYKEGYSMNYAPHVVDNVWAAAQKLGHGQYFMEDEMGGMIDDHLPINEIAGIPTIDVIHYDMSPQVMGFGYFHHTHRDNMKVIDANTLKAVGETIAYVVYND